MKIGSALRVAFGTAFLALGVIGIFLPVLPTTPFLLVAAVLYAKGSRRLHSWLVGHPVLGPRLARLSSGAGLTAKEKLCVYALACAMIVPVIVFSRSTHLRVFLLALLVLKAVVFLRLPTARARSVADTSAVPEGSSGPSSSTPVE